MEKVLFKGRAPLVLYAGVFMSQQAAVGRLSLPCTNQKYFCSQQVSCAFLHLSDVTEQDMCVCLNDNKCDTDIALSHICLIFFFLAANHLCERKAVSIRQVLPEQQRLH